MHVVLLLAAPPTPASEQAGSQAAPAAQAMISALGGTDRGQLTNKTHPDPHACTPPTHGRDKDNKGIVKNRPGGLGPQTLGYCVPRAQPPLPAPPSPHSHPCKRQKQQQGGQMDPQTHPLSGGRIRGEEPGPHVHSPASLRASGPKSSSNAPPHHGGHV